MTLRGVFPTLVWCLLVSKARCSGEEASSGIDVRGPRPVMPSHAQSSCSAQQAADLCVEGDWGRKCPSGCRLRGMLSRTEKDSTRRLDELTQRLAQLTRLHTEIHMNYRSVNDVSSQVVTDREDTETRFSAVLSELERKIIHLQTRINSQLDLLVLLRNGIDKQTNNILQMEVDIDIALRTCKGTCARQVRYRVDKDLNLQLEKANRYLSTINLVKYSETVHETFSVEREHARSLHPYGGGPAAGGLARLELHGQDGTAAGGSALSEPSGQDGTASQAAAFPSDATDQGVLHGNSSNSFEMHKVEKEVTVTSTSSVSSSSSSTLSTQKAEELSVKEVSVRTDAEDGKDTDDFQWDSVQTAAQTEEGFVRDTGADATWSQQNPRWNSDIASDDEPDFQARSHRTNLSEYIDCLDVLQRRAGGKASGLYQVRPRGAQRPITVYCEQGAEGGGWTLVQQREDGSMNFNRSFSAYREGFGAVTGSGSGELWLGLEAMYLLAQEESTMRVELQGWDGTSAHAEYTIALRDDSEGYALQVSDYRGTAGNALISGLPDDPELTSHGGMTFSAFDHDTDKWSDGSCAEWHGGGWWYNACQAANLNGVYYQGGPYDPREKPPYEVENGVVWATYRGSDYSLKRTAMLFRRVQIPILQ